MDMNNTTTPEDEKDSAQTPWWFVQALENFLNTEFFLDVCCTYETRKALFYFTKKDDGLKQKWRDVNFCNPPYSDIRPWAEKAYEQAELGRITAMLIPDKPETSLTRDTRDAADIIIHMPFRLNFIRPNGESFLDKNGKKQGPKFPVMVALFTPWGLNMPVRDIYVDFRNYKTEQ